MNFLFFSVRSLTMNFIFSGYSESNGALGGFEHKKPKHNFNSECMLEDWLVSLEWLLLVYLMTICLLKVGASTFPISVIYVLRLRVFHGSTHYLNCDGNNEYFEGKQNILKATFLNNKHEIYLIVPNYYHICDCVYSGVLKV